VSALVREAPLSAEKLAFAWREAVGPAIARATVAVLSADGCLDVQAASEAWRREIVRSEALIRVKLEACLGGGGVRSLRVTAPASEPKPRRRRSRG